MVILASELDSVDSSDLEGVTVEEEKDLAILETVFLREVVFLLCDCNPSALSRGALDLLVMEVEYCSLPTLLLLVIILCWVGQLQYTVCYLEGVEEAVGEESNAQNAVMVVTFVQLAQYRIQQKTGHWSLHTVAHPQRLHPENHTRPLRCLSCDEHCHSLNRGTG